VSIINNILSNYTHKYFLNNKKIIKIVTLFKYLISIKFEFKISVINSLFFRFFSYSLTGFQQHEELIRNSVLNFQPVPIPIVSICKIENLLGKK